MGIIDSILNLVKPKEQEPPPFTCQECGGAEFLEGPHGGDAVNFACKNCWARYNDLWPFQIDRHGFVVEEHRYLFNGPYTPQIPFPTVKQ